ncbi:MAG: hypothetical protein H0U44_09350 [Flavisolibacter sp.]|jgi:hypothetical protein|nr:hypothetical protein [Flavisolibacter sp.]
MKSLNFLPVVIAGLLMVTAVSCTTSREVYEEDDYYRASSQAPHRILVDDPYYGTIVMERDPFTGRYYQIGTLGMSPYGNSMGVYRGHVRNYPRRQPVYQRNDNKQPAVTPEQRERSRDEARKKVLGN